MQTVIKFLEALKINNNREWFNSHKNEYLIAQKNFENFLNRLIPQIREFDLDIGTITAKECIFRIYRDVRFSNDKSPYKTNMGGFIAKGGRKSGNGGYYLHVEPGGSMIAGGIYMPANDILKKIRQEIVYNTEEFKKIISTASFIKTFGQLEGEKLMRPPKDFPADYPDMDLIKLKSYTVFHNVDDASLFSKDFEALALSVFKEMQPLNKFLNQAVTNV